MAQMGFFDLSDRYASLDAKRDPLVEIDAVVPWEEFRPTLERVWRKPEAERKSRAGRKPMDAVLMFKTLVLSALYNLSDDQIEYQVRDRLSFMRFLGLGLEDRVPDAKTVWLYREGLAQAGLVEELFTPVRRLSGAPGVYRAGRADPGCVHRGGAEEPQHPRGKQDHQVRRGARGLGRQARQAVAERCGRALDEKARQEPLRLQEPRERGPQAQAGARYHVTDAALHDSQAVDHLLMQGNTGSGVWADSAYRSEAMEAKLHDRKLKSHIHRKGKRGKPLTEQAKKSNRTKSTERVRVEHVFGAQTNDMGGTLVRTVGIARAKAKIGMKNLAYNMRRLVQLRRINPCPA